MPPCITQFKAAAFDLDGTLLRSDKTISLQTQAVVHQVANAGVVTILATGRTLDTARKFYADLQMKTPLICYNGACVIEFPSGTELMHHKLSEAISRAIVRYSREYGLALHASMNHGLYFEPDSVEANSYDILSRTTGYTVDFDTISDLRFTKAMYVGDESIIEQVRSRLEADYPKSLYMVYSFKNYFEIMSIEASKRNALEFVLRRYGVEAKDTIAFGDAENDLDMLTWVGHGVAMGNAPSHVIEATQYRTESNDQEGVSKYLRQFGCL